MSSSGCPDRAYAHQGACETDTAVDCDARNIVCQPIVPPEPCPEGQVHSVVEGCHGECVPVGRCACSEPEQCPDPKGINEFTCANNRGRCTPWLG
jgi:hypothetical protein